MSQTSYLRNLVAAFAGMEGDTGPSYKSSQTNGESANIPAGILLQQYAEGLRDAEARRRGAQQLRARPWQLRRDPLGYRRDRPQGFLSLPARGRCLAAV